MSQGPSPGRSPGPLPGPSLLEMGRGWVCAPAPSMTDSPAPAPAPAPLTAIEAVPSVTDRLLRTALHSTCAARLLACSPALTDFDDPNLEAAAQRARACLNWAVHRSCWLSRTAAATAAAASSSSPSILDISRASTTAASPPHRTRTYRTVCPPGHQPRQITRWARERRSRLHDFASWRATPAHWRILTNRQPRPRRPTSTGGPILSCPALPCPALPALFCRAKGFLAFLASLASVSSLDSLHRPLPPGARPLLTCLVPKGLGPAQQANESSLAVAFPLPQPLTSAPPSSINIYRTNHCAHQITFEKCARKAHRIDNDCANQHPPNRLPRRPPSKLLPAQGPNFDPLYRIWKPRKPAKPARNTANPSRLQTPTSSPSEPYHRRESFITGTYWPAIA
ncbi:hypothetical protein N431DRAFT_456991 [Stipitochalara longipes BDJ]|nr:hypothetical protein N431DRAFT_456991 [Stipitochalara longipes BDJ]